MTTVRFEVYMHGGDTWFRLVGRNRERLLYSGPQEDLAACLDHIGELKDATNKVFRTRTSPSGKHYFTIEASDTILATGHLYRTRRERDVKMTVVRERLADAPVVMPGLEVIPRDHTERVVIEPPPGVPRGSASDTR